MSEIVDSFRSRRMLENIKKLSPDPAAPRSHSMNVGLIVQNKFQAFGPHGPVEIFTDEQPPIDLKELLDSQKPIPIDGLLGAYYPDLGQIKIFNDAITQVAKHFGLNRNDLETVVRLHEYGHALVHLGTDDAAESWDGFVADRNVMFNAIESECHELLAQLIAWHCANQAQRDCLSALMDVQPRCYQLSANERQILPQQLKEVIDFVRDPSTHDENTGGESMRNLLRHLQAEALLENQCE